MIKLNEGSSVAETIKCKILYEVLGAQLEACFDVGYGNDFKSLNERVEAFQAVFTQYTNQYTIADLVSEYGLDYFTDQKIITQNDLKFLEANDLI